MPRQEHVHKYKRHTHKSGNAVFFCVLSDCNKKINPIFTLGKRCICWKCGNEFILTEYSIRLAKPHCEACHVSKNKKTEKQEVTIQPSEAFTKTEPSILEKMNQLLRKQPETDEGDI